MSNYNTDGFFSSFKLPQGRDIPSMHTDDIYGARPKQNTLNRNIWQKDFVAETIRNQPNHKSRQENLGLKIKSPLFNDFYYKKLDLDKPTTQKAPPEVIQGRKHQSQPEQFQRPTHEYNDALQNFMTNNASTAKRYDNSKVNNHQQNVQNYEHSFGQNKSDLIMHIDPARSIYKSQPFANFQTNKIDDTKDLLRPDNHKFSQAQRLKTYDTFSQTNKFPSLPQSQRNNNNMYQHRQIRPMQQSQSTEQMQQYANNNNSSISYMPNGQQQQNNSMQNENIPAPAPAPAPQQKENGYQQQQQSMQQNPQHSQSEAILRTLPDQYNNAPPAAPQMPPVSQTPQQFGKADFAPPSQQNFASATQMGRKTYKPYNVISHKRHQQYQPKYELPTNHWDCYDKPKWENYVAKKDAPRNIFREKNRNNIKTVDFSTSNNEYGELKQKYKV